MATQILACLFFLLIALLGLFRPEQIYTHALRPVYRSSSTAERETASIEKSGYLWTVRIIGAGAAVIFTLTLVHLFSATPAAHRNAIQPADTLPQVIR